MTRPDMLPSALCTASAPRIGLFRGSMAGLCVPLSTLRRSPHEQLRMTRGRCGSLLLHRKGLAPSTPCRSPGASHNESGYPQQRRESGHRCRSHSGHCRHCSSGAIWPLILLILRHTTALRRRLRGTTARWTPLEYLPDEASRSRSSLTFEARLGGLLCPAKWSMSSHKKRGSGGVAPHPSPPSPSIDQREQKLRDRDQSS